MKISSLNKNCPVCNKTQVYSCVSALNLSIRKNTKCSSCNQKGKPAWNSGKSGLQIAWNKGLTKDMDLRVKQYSLSQKNKKISDEQRKNHSKKMMGKHHTEETKYKLRVIAINELNKNGIIGKLRNYNPNACQFIENFGSQNGYNFQHAMNGGEVEIYGYFLDGYDKEKNVVFEYDEPKHRFPSYKQNDLIRQKRIVDNIKPISFFRYDEHNKVLYDVITNVIL
jgi:hypothetical protein